MDRRWRIPTASKTGSIGTSTLGFRKNEKVLINPSVITARIKQQCYKASDRVKNNCWVEKNDAEFQRYTRKTCAAELTIFNSQAFLNYISTCNLLIEDHQVDKIGLNFFHLFAQAERDNVRSWSRENVTTWQRDNVKTCVCTSTTSSVQLKLQEKSGHVWWIKFLSIFTWRRFSQSSPYRDFSVEPAFARNWGSSLKNSTTLQTHTQHPFLNFLGQLFDSFQHQSKKPQNVEWIFLEFRRKGFYK